jgi:membrane protease YdiL (CAAX protease family)
MKREIKIAILIMIGSLSFLWLEKPLKVYLSDHWFDLSVAKQISAIVVRSILIVTTLMCIIQLRLLHFTGLDHWKNIKNIQATMIALVFIMVGISNNWNTYITAGVDLVLLFAISTLAVGVFEELLFRGLVFPLLIRSFSKSKSAFLWSAILSNLMFGLMHFINIFSQPENVVGILSQVFFATSIGVFFCGLMVRTEHILIPILIHALVNFGFGADEIKGITEIKEASTSGVNWNSLIPTTLFFSFIFAGGIFMIQKADQPHLLEKLK